MKRVFSALLLCFMALKMPATQQIPDRLIANGKTYQIGSYTYIMEGYFETKGIPRPPWNSTALYRGYVAEMEISDGKLFCKRFFNYEYDENYKRHEKDLDILKDGKPVFCEWFSGKGIRLEEVREFPYRYMLEENSCVLDVKNGAAEIRLARHIPEKRFSIEDLDRRRGVEYDPQKDNLDSWMELQHTMLGDYKRFSHSTTLDIIKKVLGMESVKTRGIHQGQHRSIVSLYLPATRSSMAEQRSVKAGALDTQKYAGKAVEMEIKNPLTIDAEIVGIRELEKTESIHNMRDEGVLPRDYKEQDAFDAEAEKLYPIIGAESATPEGLNVELNAENREFKLKISNIKKGETAKPDYIKYVYFDGNGEFNIAEHFPAKNIKGHTFLLEAKFKPVRLNDGDFSKLENWEYPKKAYLAGKLIWDFDKENSKTLKFITDKSAPFSTDGMSDIEALETLAILAEEKAYETDSGRNKMEAISARVAGIDFKLHQKFAYLLSWAINFKIGKKHLYMYADKLADFCGKEVPFNREFIDSEDFNDEAKRKEASGKSYRILCDSYKRK